MQTISERFANYVPRERTGASLDPFWYKTSDGASQRPNLGTFELSGDHGSSGPGDDTCTSDGNFCSGADGGSGGHELPGTHHGSGTGDDTGTSIGTFGSPDPIG